MGKDRRRIARLGDTISLTMLAATTPLAPSMRCAWSRPCRRSCPALATQELAHHGERVGRPWRAYGRDRGGDRNYWAFSTSSDVNWSLAETEGFEPSIRLITV